LELYGNNNTSISWSNPTLINGPTTISGVYAPPAGSNFGLCLTVLMSTSLNNPPQYCADTTICFIEPPCEIPVDSTCLMNHVDSICVGQNVTFLYTGNANATTYTWQFPFGTPSTLTGIGPHTVTYNTVGCHPIILILNDNLPGTVDCVDSICAVPNPVTSVVQWNNSLQANPAGMSYQWYSQNPNWTLLTGETNQFLNPINGGLYSVVVTNSFGCSDTASIDFAPIGVEEFKGQDWNVYPNPNDGVFTIDFASTSNERVEMRIYSTLGELIEMRTLHVHPGSLSFVIDPPKMVSGVYSILIISESGRASKTLIVR
jgi:hypothetical protein